MEKRSEPRGPDDEDGEDEDGEGDGDVGNDDEEENGPPMLPGTQQKLREVSNFLSVCFPRWAYICLQLGIMSVRRDYGSRPVVRLDILPQGRS